MSEQQPRERNPFRAWQTAVRMQKRMHAFLEGNPELAQELPQNQKERAAKIHEVAIETVVTALMQPGVITDKETKTVDDQKLIHFCKVSLSALQDLAALNRDTSTHITVADARAVEEKIQTMINDQDRLGNFIDMAIHRMKQ